MVDIEARSHRARIARSADGAAGGWHTSPPPSSPTGSGRQSRATAWKGAGGWVIVSHDRQLNFSRICSVTSHCREITSSVSMTSSPILERCHIDRAFNPHPRPARKLDLDHPRARHAGWFCGTLQRRMNQGMPLDNRLLPTLVVLNSLVLPAVRRTNDTVASVETKRY
jgi:hypothetical protein